VLASSLSDDMDIKGVESGKIKMSGIAGSSGLADRDGQDSRSNSLEDVGSVLGAIGQEKLSKYLFDRCNDFSRKCF
jgi:hypothetical protein